MMKTIKAGLWPRAARRVATEHNRKHHRGKATAEIDVDPDPDGAWLPKYRVRCPVCPPEEQASMELGS